MRGLINRNVAAHDLDLCTWPGDAEHRLACVLYAILKECEASPETWTIDKSVILDIIEGA